MKDMVAPEVVLNSGRRMPLIGMGTAADPRPSPEVIKAAVLQAIELGYRHFDAASVYRSEQPLGEALAEAIQAGLVRRDQLFVTSKLWAYDAHPDLVLPALHRSLQNLGLEYLDLYLIHWPFSANKPENNKPFSKDLMVPMDFKSTWEAMEECQRLGLAKSIGVSNFSCKKLAGLLATAKIPPAVNQVEMHPLWKQKNLREFCADNGIHVSAWSPLGGYKNSWGTNQVMECPVLKEIAQARGKSVAQVALRWVFEQGTSLIVKSFNKERMKENLQIFDWELSEEELKKISLLPQHKICAGEIFVSADGLFKSLEELWDGEI